MRLLHTRLDILPSGMTHNDMAYIHAGRQALHMKPLSLRTRTVYYGLETKRWRIDWYDLWTQRFGRPQITHR